MGENQATKYDPENLYQGTIYQEIQFNLNFKDTKRKGKIKWGIKGQFRARKRRN